MIRIRKRELRELLKTSGDTKGIRLGRGHAAATNGRFLVKIPAQECNLGEELHVLDASSVEPTTKVGNRDDIVTLVRTDHAWTAETGSTRTNGILEVDHQYPNLEAVTDRFPPDDTELRSVLVNVSLLKRALDAVASSRGDDEKPGDAVVKVSIPPEGSGNPIIVSHDGPAPSGAAAWLMPMSRS
ncbi:MAG: hypothetical protein ACE5F1_16260 [Planctomycetota bacterium]